MQSAYSKQNALYDNAKYIMLKTHNIVILVIEFRLNPCKTKCSLFEVLKYMG